MDSTIYKYNPSIFNNSMIAATQNPNIKEAESKCAMQIIFVKALIYIMYTEAVSTWDMLEEHGLMKHGIKKYTKLCQAVYKKYAKIERGLYEKEETWYLEQDMFIDAYNQAEGMINDMRAAFREYLVFNKCKRCEIIAQLALTLKMGRLLGSMWKSFFKKFRDNYGVNLEPSYKYADMSLFVKYFQCIVEIIIKDEECDVIDFTKDKKCENAMNVFDENVFSSNVMNKAAHTALTYMRQHKAIMTKEKEKENE